jgi:hypothetical protein
MALKLITGPSTEPITLTEAKLHIKQDCADDDTLIMSLIVSARQMCESRTHRRFITQTWEKYADDWPQIRSPYLPGAFDYSLDSLLLYPVSFNNPFELRMRRKPYIELLPGVQAVSSFTYTTVDGSINTLDPAIYEVDNIGTIGRVVLAPNQTWPNARLRSANGICIRFTCGYGAAADVPQAIKQAMLMLIGLWNDHRAASEEVRSFIEVPFAVDALLAAETVLTI